MLPTNERTVLLLISVLLRSSAWPV